MGLGYSKIDMSTENSKSGVFTIKILSLTFSIEEKVTRVALHCSPVIGCDGGSARHKYIQLSAWDWLLGGAAEREGARAKGSLV